MPPVTISAQPSAWAAVGDYVRQRREALGMSQTALCAASGVSQSVVSKIENKRPDNGRVRTSTLADLSRALRLDPSALEVMAGGGPSPDPSGGEGDDSSDEVIIALKRSQRIDDLSRSLILAAYREAVTITSGVADHG